MERARRAATSASPLLSSLTAPPRAGSQGRGLRWIVVRFWLAAAVLLVTLALGAAAYAITRPRVSPGARGCERGLGAGWTCRTVRVALDPAKPHGAHVDLAVARFHRPGPARPAVMAFAGGPGGAALPRTRRYQQLLAPLLTHRDPVVFDQRGTGVSERLRCPGVRGPRIAPTAVRTCARQLGARGGRYGSWDTADDAEAVRRSLRVPSVLAFGVSYGTKTATDYARRY